MGDRHVRISDDRIVESTEVRWLFVFRFSQVSWEPTSQKLQRRTDTRTWLYHTYFHSL